MNLPVTITFAGRSFSAAELALIRQAAHDYAPLGLTEIARTICEWLDWKRPTGRLKNHECRQLLERLQQQGVLTLPELRSSGPRGPRTIAIDAFSDPQRPIHATVANLKPLRLTLLDSATDSGNSGLWSQFIQRYHYLGYRVPVGAHLRYFVHSAEGQILACLLWTSPAWKMKVRDQWIGWSTQQRARNLQYVVNHSRFLILPWVRVNGLASTILSLSARQLPEHWRQHYGYTPLLFETLVDASRFNGTCYRAANWIPLGLTAGRGRMDRHHQANQATKLLFIFPLNRNVQQRLCDIDPPQSLIHSC
jgi:hypothetical protein